MGSSEFSTCIWRYLKPMFDSIFKKSNSFYQNEISRMTSIIDCHHFVTVDNSSIPVTSWSGQDSDRSRAI